MEVWGYNHLAQGADYSLTESAFSPFQAEPTQPHDYSFKVTKVCSKNSAYLVLHS